MAASGSGDAVVSFFLPGIWFSDQHFDVIPRRRIQRSVDVRYGGFIFREICGLYLLKIMIILPGVVGFVFFCFFNLLSAVSLVRKLKRQHCSWQYSKL